MKESWLQLNAAKTEVIFLGPKAKLIDNISLSTEILILGQPVCLAKKIHTLGVILDSELSLTPQVSAVVSTCFHQIRRL